MFLQMFFKFSCLPRCFVERYIPRLSIWFISFDTFEGYRVFFGDHGFSESGKQ